MQSYCKLHPSPKVSLQTLDSLCLPLPPPSDFVQGVAMSTTAGMPFHSLVQTPIFPSPLRALVSRQCSNKHHHHPVTSGVAQTGVGGIRESQHLKFRRECTPVAFGFADKKCTHTLCDALLLPRNGNPTNTNHLDICLSCFREIRIRIAVANKKDHIFLYVCEGVKPASS